MRKYLWLAGASLSLSACERAQVQRAQVHRSSVEADGKDVPSMTGRPWESIAGLRVYLVDSNPCVVRYGQVETDKELPLKVSSPCALHRDTAGAVRVQTLKDKKVFLIESSVTDLDRRGDCNTQIQGIIVSPGGVRASPEVERIAMCTPFQWDDVMFIGLSEQAH